MAITLPWSRAAAPAHALDIEADHADDMDGLEKFTLAVNMAAQGLYVARWYIGDEVIRQTLGITFLLWATTIIGLLAGISLDTTAVVTTMGRRRGRYHRVWSNLTIFSAAAFSGLIALQVHGGGIVPAAWLHVANVVAVVCLIQHLSQPRQAPASERQRAASLEQELAAQRQATASAEQRATDLEQTATELAQQLAAAQQGRVTTEQMDTAVEQAIAAERQVADKAQRAWLIEAEKLNRRVADLTEIATAPIDFGDKINSAWLVAAAKKSKSWSEIVAGSGASMSTVRRLAASVEGM